MVRTVRFPVCLCCVMRSGVKGWVEGLSDEFAAYRYEALLGDPLGKYFYAEDQVQKFACLSCLLLTCVLCEGR